MLRSQALRSPSLASYLPTDVIETRKGSYFRVIYFYLWTKRVVNHSLGNITVCYVKGANWQKINSYRNELNQVTSSDNTLCNVM